MNWNHSFRQIVLLTGLMLVGPTWAANKCVGAEGKIVWQDAPCGADAKNLVPEKSQSPKQSEVMSPDAIARALDGQLDQPETRKKMQAAVERREASQRLEASSRSNDAKVCGDRVEEQPSVGMTESRFLQCTQFARTWEQVKINETETKYGVTKQYVYAPHSPIRYIYISGGKITTISR